MKIELVRFDDEQADFEIGDFTASCNVSWMDLKEFLNGELIIEPYAWFDIEESEVAKPEWFGRNELSDLNNVFERDFKKFIK